jgi:choline dehydrogenase-like flavoprotein
MEYQDNEHRMKIDALRAILEMTDSAGLYLIGTHIAAPGRYVHELGGARMGRDRESSVLDPWNRCWDTLNLLVLDGASFPSSGWQDPSLTMMAIAARSCRIMTEKRGRQ